MRRINLSSIQLNDDQKEQLQEEIKAFYFDAFDEEIGIVKQQQILELFTEQMAPIIYNKALDDVKNWHKAQLDNMEADYYMLYKEL